MEGREIDLSRDNGFHPVGEHEGRDTGRLSSCGPKSPKHPREFFRPFSFSGI